MKKLFLFLFSMAIVSSTFAKVNLDITTVSMGYGDKSEHSFWIKGDVSADLVTKIWEIYGKKQKRGYITKYKKIAVPGFDQLLSLKVHEGVYGDKAAESGCSGSYFNSFVSEKYRQERIQRMKENEEFGIIIYVKKKNGVGINSFEEIKAFKNFLEGLI